MARVMHISLDSDGDFSKTHGTLTDPEKKNRDPKLTKQE